MTIDKEAIQQEDLIGLRSLFIQLAVSASPEGDVI